MMSAMINSLACAEQARHCSIANATGALAKNEMKTAGYSRTPLYKKLGIKAGDRVWFSGNPDGYQSELQKAGEFQFATKLTANLDFVHLFTTSRGDLTRNFPKLKGVLKPDGMLWISWPKKSSGVKTDLDENIVRKVGLKMGLVDVKVCAVDDVWSGLKFVLRLKDR
jgi:hypothetical protein